MQIADARDAALRWVAAVPLPRRSLLPTTLSAIVPAGILLVVLATPLGPDIMRWLPCAIVPAVGLTFLAIDHKARTLPVALWALVVSVVSLAIVPSAPLTPVSSLTIATAAFPAIALAVGIAVLRRTDGVTRAALLVVAVVFALSMLFVPVAMSVRDFQTVTQHTIADFRMGGTLHQNAFADYGTDFVTLMDLLRAKTPDDATIALPDHYLFIAEGNAGLVNYFAYPRTIRSESISHTPVFDIAGATYIAGVAQNNRNVWPLIAVPVRTYFHAPALHEVTFGDITVHSTTTATIPASALQPSQTDADRTLESDVTAQNGTRTVRLNVTASTTDPWIAPVDIALTNATAMSVTVQTNESDNRAISEQVAMLAEIRGPGEETALFASRPAARTVGPITLSLTDLSNRATEYARARGWQPGPLHISGVGLEMGWQVPLPQTKTDVLAEIERGVRAPAAGPDTFTGLAGDAQRQMLAKNPNAAVDRYAAALLLRPNDYDGQLALAEAFAAAGHWRKGAQFLTSLLIDRPNDPWIRYRLATMQREMGDRTAARVTLAPLVTSVPVVHVSRPASAPAPASRARLAATAVTFLDEKGLHTRVTITYDTGDGAAGQVTVSRPDGRESVVATGKSGTMDVPDPGQFTTLTFRLQGGARQAPLDTLAVEYLNRAYLPEYTPWASLFWAQLTAELGDVATARLLYQSLAKTPGAYGAIAQQALQRLNTGTQP